MECPNNYDNETRGELIAGYIAGSLTPEEHVEFDRHLSSCKLCADAAAVQQAVWNALDEWQAVPVSDTFDARLYERIAEDAASAWWRRLMHMDWHWVVRPAMPLAAACAALTLAFFVHQPAAPPAAHSQDGRNVSIEQVERALDDMDMLRQVNLAAPSDAAQSRSM